MATLTIIPQWVDGIYQLETSDPVMGGADGIDNRQAKELGARTEWLKQQLEALNGGSGNIKEKTDKDTFDTLKTIFVGIPIPYPLAVVPDGCLALNGQKFDTARYPQLAKVYPSGTLPDLRGEFIRGWDNGRGADAGRALLSWQNDDDKQRRVDFGSVDIGGFEGTFNVKNIDTSQTRVYVPNEDQTVPQSQISTENGALVHTYKFGTSARRGNLPPGDNSWYDYYVSLQWGNGEQTRPRNIAYQYICLAA